MDGTILGQGVFTASSTGLANPNPGNATIAVANPAYIQIPSNADWLSVRNYTRFGTVGTNAAYFTTNNAFVGVEFYWQRGMPAGGGIVKYYANSGQVITGDIYPSSGGGFTLYDPSGQSQGAQPLLGPAVAVSAVTDATQPVVTHTADTNVKVGTVVRLSNTAQTDVNGIDMVVGAVGSSTSFTLLTSTNALATAPGAVGGAGFYRIVYNANNPLFYPRRRVITNINKTTNQVSTAIAHGLTPGQEVRFNIPAVSGMIQLNPDPLNNYFPTGSSTAAIVQTVVDDYNFIINIDTSSYTAFTWPIITQQPSSFPEVTPFGEDTATSLSSITAQVPTIGGVQIYNTNTGILADSTVNTGYLGMILGSGGVGTVATTTPIIGPSGALSWSSGDVATGDTVYWLAGKSTYGGL